MAACGTIEMEAQRIPWRNSSSLNSMISLPSRYNPARIFPGVARQKAQNGLGERTFTATRFAKDHHRPIGVKFEIHTIHRLNRPMSGIEMQHQVFNTEKLVIFVALVRYPSSVD